LDQGFWTYSSCLDSPWGASFHGRGIFKRVWGFDRAMKEILVAIIKQSIKGVSASTETLENELKESSLNELNGGVFDILHPGHAFILKEAKSHADILVVIVARDSTVKKRKKIPIVPEEQRREMVGGLKPVDVSVLGYEGDTLRIVEEIKPDVIALGPDQHHDEQRIKMEMAKRGINLEVIRIKEYKECELNSTKAILQRIIERNYPNSRGG
jgi:FAD synthetase